MVAPTKYRSVFTGPEIDEAIATMKTSGSTPVVNDFSGGADKIASAELVKTLKGIVDTNNTGSNIKARLLTDISNHVLNQAEYTALLEVLDGSTNSFRGTYINASVRESALVSKYPTFNGGEITFLIDDGSGDGLSEFSRWNINTAAWEKVQLYNQGGIPALTISAASTFNLFAYRTNRYSSMKCLVQVKNAAGTSVQVQEVLIANTNADTYISVYNDVGNGDLFSLSTTVAGGFVNLAITTKSANLKVSGKILAMV